MKKPQLSFRLHPETLKKFEQFKELSGFKTSQICSKALKEYFKKELPPDN